MQIQWYSNDANLIEERFKIRLIPFPLPDCSKYKWKLEFTYFFLISKHQNSKEFFVEYLGYYPSWPK